jgi:hypothetical protein
MNWRLGDEQSDHRHRRLLRTRCERPRRRTAEQRHEFPPLPSITSSARASSDGGTSRCRSLAQRDQPTSNVLSRATTDQIWEHTIKIERLTDPEPGMVYPRLTEVSGRCPPEDCGGPWGYAELIEAIKDPKHERHDELTEWIGDDFDPHADQAEWLTAEVDALAKKWSRKPASKRARRG